MRTRHDRANHEARRSRVEVSNERDTRNGDLKEHRDWQVVAASRMERARTSDTIGALARPISLARKFGEELAPAGPVRRCSCSELLAGRHGEFNCLGDLPDGQPNQRNRGHRNAQTCALSRFSAIFVTAMIPTLANEENHRESKIDREVSQPAVADMASCQYDSGDVAWVMMATVLVLGMIPGHRCSPSDWFDFTLTTATLWAAAITTLTAVQFL